jgi:hypothetical protein
MNTRKRKQENLLEHTIPADKSWKREKIDEGATTKLVMDGLTNLSQSVNDAEKLQNYLPQLTFNTIMGSLLLGERKSYRKISFATGS